MAGKARTVLEWCGKGFVATVSVSGGSFLRLELPEHYILMHHERRADGTQVLGFGVPWITKPAIPEGEDTQGSEDVVHGAYADEEALSPSASSPSDSRCIRLKVANNYKVKFPRSSLGSQGPE